MQYVTQQKSCNKRLTTSVLELGLTVSLHLLKAGRRGEAKGIKVRNRGNGAWQAIRESVGIRSPAVHRLELGVRLSL
jgi:hypothetical protein